MFEKSREPIIDHAPTWKSYQKELQKKPLLRMRRRNGYKWIVVAMTLIMMLGGICFAIVGAVQQFFEGSESSDLSQTASTEAAAYRIAKTDLRYLLDPRKLTHLAERSFYFDFSGSRYRAETSIDPSLQQFVRDHLDTDNSRYIGIVVMEPKSGRILSMVSYDKTDPAENVCTAENFPAASVFKIVSAAAAIEQCDFTDKTRLEYNGASHTLYRSQLKERKNKYTNRVSLKDAFAKSVNPVFGKIGALHLDAEAIVSYADSFGFNRDISFDIPLTRSRMEVTDDPYRKAEITSGFNRQTIITPLHGALISAAVANGGNLIEPILVERISDETDSVMYQARPKIVQRSIAEKTAIILQRLMQETIRSGTCRKTFRGAYKDSVLSKLTMGGKTGSMDNNTHDLRYDWFTGFAEEKNGKETVVVSAVVAHHEYIGRRASEYARMIFKQYFNHYFAEKKEGGKAS